MSDAVKEADIKELQKSYMEMQQLDAQMKQASQQVVALDQQIAEIHAISQSIADIGEVKAGTEILVPIANGIFAKATLMQSKELLVNVGASVIVPTPVADVRKLLDEQAARVVEAKDGIAAQMDALKSQAKKVETKLKKLIA